VRVADVGVAERRSCVGTHCINQRSAATSCLLCLLCAVFQDALVELEKSLLARERFLHPFNKELLRTLR